MKDTIILEAEHRRTILESSAQTASGQGSAINSISGFTSATFMLDVTADESTSADFLDVCVQRLLPDGTTWDTVGRFPSHAGDTGADKYVLDISAGASDNQGRAADDSTSSPTISAGTSYDVPWGDQLRVIWIVTDDSGSASFTFSVTAHFRL